MNLVWMIGTLTGDPARFKRSGVAGAGWSMESLSDRAAEPSVFVDVVAFDRLAECCVNSLTTGQRVVVYGRMAHRNGNHRAQLQLTAIDVEFLDKAHLQTAGRPQRSGRQHKTARR